MPIIGGGGAIAIISAFIGQNPAPTQTPAAQLRSQAAPQPAPRLFAFDITYDPKTESPLPPTEGSTGVTAIKIYVDDLLLDTLETDAQSEVDGDFSVPTLGRHRYNVTGFVFKATPSGQKSKIEIGGEGTIYVQDGSEFRLVLDRAAARRPNRAIMKLERAY